MTMKKTTGAADTGVTGVMLGAARSGKSGRPRKTPAVERDVEDRAGDGAGNSIRAMLVGLNILKAMGREGRPAPLRDIAVASGLSVSRVHRYLTSLVKTGFAEQDAASGHYWLGQALVGLGLQALGQLESTEVSVEALVNFSKTSGLDGHVAVWGAYGPTVIRWQSGNFGYRLKIEEGRVLPLLWSATGRVLMAWRNFEETLPLLEPELTAWNRKNPKSPLTKARIRTLFAAVRDSGFSCSIPDQSKEGLWGGVYPRPPLETIAAPVLDHVGRVTSALTAFGGEHSIVGSSDFNHVEQLRRAADEASRRLGFVQRS
jgi:DNA-binding IclR family transcriptional regulator